MASLAGCNQVFGLHHTHLKDDGPLAIDAPPSIEFVQGTAFEVVNGTTNALAFERPITAHSAIIVGAYVESTTVASVTDSFGLTYQRVVGPIIDPSTPANLYIYAAFDAPGGADTVTVTAAAQCPSVEIYIHELTNLVSFDAGTGMSGSTTNCTQDDMTSGPFQTHASYGLLFGFGVADIAHASAGYTSYSSYDNNATEGLVLTAAGTQNATESCTQNGAWTMLGAAFVGR